MKLQSRQRSTEEVATCLMATHRAPNGEVVELRIIHMLCSKIGTKGGTLIFTLQCCIATLISFGVSRPLDHALSRARPIVLQTA